MPDIYTIGETVLDIIFKNEQPVAAKPGGSMLNTSVSLVALVYPFILFLNMETMDWAI